MIATRPVVTCVRCKLRRQHIARGLCKACYELVNRQGGLDEYELVNPDQTSMYCLCPTPTLAHIALFHATFCGRCKRAIRGVTDHQENP